MRTRPRTIVTAVLVTVLAFAATACGDDDGGGGEVSAEAQPYVDAMKESMRTSNQEDDSDFQLSDGQIDCLAPRWINTFGVDRLEEQGVTAEDIAADTDMEFTDLDLTEDEGGALYDAFGECDVNLSEIMLEEMAADEDMTEAAKTCMEGIFTDENLRKLMVSSMVNGEDAMEDDPELAPLMGQLMGCAFMSMGDSEGDGDGSTEDTPAQEEFDEMGSEIEGG